MIASVQYGDFKGTAAADISDHIQGGLEGIADYFGLDKARFILVGLSIHGTEDFIISLLCVDVEKSTVDKEHLVDIWMNDNGNKHIAELFKRLNVVLHSRHDDKYSSLDSDSEANFDELHTSKEK